MQQTSLIEQMLSVKNKLKGDFKERAIFAQQLKSLFRATGGWDNLSDDKKEALEGIIEGVSDVLNGDPEQEKPWYKIEGYGRIMGDSVSTKKEREAFANG